MHLLIHLRIMSLIWPTTKEALVDLKRITDFEALRKSLGSPKMTAVEKHTIRAFKSFGFGRLTRGDCTVDDGNQFHLNDDGSTYWDCYVSSTDTGDEWDGDFLGGLAGFDANNIGTYDKLLFVTPHYHFDIHDSNTKKHWTQSFAPLDNQYANGSNPVDAYNRTAIVWFYCGC
jgi:hypothetical protein